MRACLLLLAMGACGGEDGTSTPDAAPPPPDARAGCTLEPGVSYVVSALGLASAADGFDLDGDGQPDNAVGGMPDSYRENVSSNLNTTVVEGYTIAVGHVTRWEGDPTADDPEVGFALFIGVDSDMPGDPSDNFTGEEDYYVLSTQFDIDCQPTVATGAARVESGVLIVEGGSWTVAQPPSGTIEARDVHARLTFVSPELVEARVGAIMTLCSLSNTPIAGLPGTFLEFLINDPAIADVVHPDIDRDGDGLESVSGDGVGVRDCRDGDGTVITGATCPCDPRMADAYSIAFDASAVPARLIGILDPP